MKLIIHDLSEDDFSSLKIGGGDVKIINAGAGVYAPCLGCFHCWLKTPGTCKINDGLKNSGAATGNSNETIIISRNCYGGYSEKVKRVFDRAISSGLPFFTYRGGRIHHRRRYAVEKKSLTVILYGDFLESEKNAAQLIVDANRVNFGFAVSNLHIVRETGEIGNYVS